MWFLFRSRLLQLAVPQFIQTGQDFRCLLSQFSIADAVWRNFTEFVAFCILNFVGFYFIFFFVFFLIFMIGVFSDSATWVLSFSNGIKSPSSCLYVGSSGKPFKLVAGYLCLVCFVDLSSASKTGSNLSCELCVSSHSTHE